MKLSWFPARKCYRLIVPARWSDENKRQAVYFPSITEGNKYIAAKLNRPASNHSVRMPLTDQVFLEELRALLGSNEGIKQAVEFYRKTVLSVKKQGTVRELLTAYLACQYDQGNRTCNTVTQIRAFYRYFRLLCRRFHCEHRCLQMQHQGCLARRLGVRKRSEPVFSRIAGRFAYAER